MLHAIRKTLICSAALAGFALTGSAAHGAVFEFAADPFAGTTALSDPGRQVIGNELTIPVFDIGNDVLALNTGVFGFGARINFANASASNLTDGLNFVVLQDFDGDGDPMNGNQLNAGLAADLIAAGLDTSGAGFFIYFNSGLDLPRLVFSTDLGSSAADLKVLARFTGLAGQPGRDLLPTISAANVAAVPEPASWAMMIGGFALVGAAARRRVRDMVAA